MEGNEGAKEEKAKDPLREFRESCEILMTSNLSSEGTSAPDYEEIKINAEQAVYNLVDKTRQLDQFFTKSLALFSLYKPEEVIEQKILQMEQDIRRKDEMIAKHRQHLIENLGQKQQPGSQSGSHTLGVSAHAGDSDQPTR